MVQAVFMLHLSSWRSRQRIPDLMRCKSFVVLFVISPPRRLHAYWVSNSPRLMTIPGMKLMRPRLSAGRPDVFDAFLFAKSIQWSPKLPKLVTVRIFNSLQTHHVPENCGHCWGTRWIHRWWDWFVWHVSCQSCAHRVTKGQKKR